MRRPEPSDRYKGPAVGPYRKRGEVWGDGKRRRRYEMAPCGECPRGRCDRCDWCLYFEEEPWKR